MPIDLTQPALGYVIAVELKWNLGNQVRRYCRADHDLIIAASPYAAIPQMEFKHQPMHGGAVDVKGELTLPIDTEPLKWMIASPFAPVTVTVYEVDIDDLANPRCVYHGEIASTIARFRGKADLITARLEGIRRQLEDVSLGIKVTDRCPWFFGDASCGFNLATATTTATIIAIVGDEIEVDVLADDVAGGGNGFYTRGHVEFESLRIMVRQHIVGQRKLRLAEAAPQITGHTWLSQVVTIVGGCAKDIPDCTFFGRQISFGGIGRKMVPYNPIIEGSSL